MRLLFLLTLLVNLVFCSYNSDRYRDESCKPARDCKDENVCYCSERFDGWENGGGMKTRQFGSRSGAKCAKFGKDCECEDCGVWGWVDSVQCKESRCDDENAVEEAGVCYNIDKLTGSKLETSTNTNFNCYLKKTACDPSICGFGTKLTNCKRISAGSCTACPALADGHFWTKSGACDQTRCSSVGVGKFLGKACTATADAVMSSCSTHSGNIGYIVPRQDGKSTYYCPGNGLVLPLPENSEPTPDYSGFVCIDGYYLHGASCLPCVQGSVCKYGRSYVCPVHYYSSSFASTFCSRCAAECGSEWFYPVRCNQGSTSNVGCVPCGGCSYDSKRGLSCVTESYEMQGLQVRCVPSNVDSVVAVCA